MRARLGAACRREGGADLPRRPRNPWAIPALPFSTAAGCALLAAVAVAGPGLAQEPADPLRSITSARLSARVEPDREDVEVRIEYRLRGGTDAPTEPVRVHLLGVGGARVEDFESELPGAPGGPGTEAGPRRPHALSAEGGALYSGLVDLPGGLEQRLVVRYRVTGALQRDGEDARLRIPVLVVDLPVLETTPSTFRTALTVPDGWAVSGAFPSGLAPDGEGAWSGTLQVVPAFVSLRARTDGSWRPGLPWALDLVTVLVLAVVSFLGWRHLSGVVREARA